MLAGRPAWLDRIPESLLRDHKGTENRYAQVPNDFGGKGIGVGDDDLCVVELRPLMALVVLFWKGLSGGYGAPARVTDEQGAACR